MNAEIFAEWLRRRGHRVVRTESSYWFNQGPRVYQAFPYHWVIDPSEDELKEFLKREKGIGLRYSTSLSAAYGNVSYHAVYVKSAYDFSDLGKWARKNVRRGMRKCSVEPITFQMLAKYGYTLQLDTLNRQGRRLKFGYKQWRTLCEAAATLESFEAWGAMVEGKLAASVITFQMDDCCYMLYQQCHRDYLRDHVNNALSFVVTKTMMERPQINSILYGLHSLDAPSSVDEFKFRMGYTAKSVRQRVVFHPMVAPFFNKASHILIKRLCNLFPSNPFLAKTEGMVRFYLEGKRPLSEQTWPEPLEGRKEELIKKLEANKGM